MIAKQPLAQHGDGEQRRGQNLQLVRDLRERQIALVTPSWIVELVLIWTRSALSLDRVWSACFLCKASTSSESSGAYAAVILKDCLGVPLPKKNTSLPRCSSVGFNFYPFVLVIYLIQISTVRPHFSVACFKVPISKQIRLLNGNPLQSCFLFLQKALAVGSRCRGSLSFGFFCPVLHSQATKLSFVIEGADIWPQRPPPRTSTQDTFSHLCCGQAARG